MYCIHPIYCKCSKELDSRGEAGGGGGGGGGGLPLWEKASGMGGLGVLGVLVRALLVGLGQLNCRR